MTKDPNEFLFEKMFFQAAHIAILEEALATARADFVELSHLHDVSSELNKIGIAYSSIDKLKRGTT